MNRRNALIPWAFLVLLLLFPLCSSSAHDLVWPGEKLKTLYPEAETFEQKNLYISDQQRAALEKKLGGSLPEEDLKPSVYFAIVRSGPDARPRKAAVLLFVDAHGENGQIEMGVAVSGKGELIRVHVFENKEPAKLSSPDFLKQFDGKKASDTFQIGSDIQAPAGTERSAQAIASGARRGLLLIEELFRKQ